VRFPGRAGKLRIANTMGSRQGNGIHQARSRCRRAGSGLALAGIDRMVRNIEIGRFERSPLGPDRSRALVTAAEIYFEHHSASFGNKMM
jgi:hypothetical protein